MVMGYDVFSVIKVLAIELGAIYRCSSGKRPCLVFFLTLPKKYSDDREMLLPTLNF